MSHRCPTRRAAIARQRIGLSRPASAPAARPTRGPLLILRISAVYAQAATIAITWPLWQVRHYVATADWPELPNLPALPLPQFDVGLLLFGSLLLVLIVPRWGVAVHGAMLLAAILLDQMRMQPECVSLFLLMLGTLDSPSLKMVARAI